MFLYPWECWNMLAAKITGQREVSSTDVLIKQVAGSYISLGAIKRVRSAPGLDDISSEVHWRRPSEKQLMFLNRRDSPSSTSRTCARIMRERWNCGSMGLRSLPMA